MITDRRQTIRVRRADAPLRRVASFQGADAPPEPATRPVSLRPTESSAPMPARRSDHQARPRPGTAPARSRFPRTTETAVVIRSGAAPAGLASPLLLGLTLTAIVAVLPQAAFAQARGVVERNLPPIVGGSGGLAQGATPATPTEDATALGTDLTGIRLIGPDGAVAAKPHPGLSVTGVEGVPTSRLDAA